MAKTPGITKGTHTTHSKSSNHQLAFNGLQDLCPSTAPPPPVILTGPPFGFQQTSPPLPHSSPQFLSYASPIATQQDWSSQPTHHTYNQTHFSPPPGPHPSYPSQEPQAQSQAYNGYANQQFEGRRTPDRSSSNSWAPTYNNQGWNDINPVQRVATAPAAPMPYHPFEYSCAQYWNA